jgi:hypothetical protein
MYRPFRLRLSHTASVFKNFITAAWNFKDIFILLVGRCCCEQCRQESVLPVSMPIPEGGEGVGGGGGRTPGGG